jgi:acetylornithine deacetylase
MLLAFVATRIIAPDLRTPVTLALAVGEENSGDGIERFVRSGRRFSFAIVGEPTDLRIATTQAGYIEVLIEATAKSCHAFDPIADQAIMVIVDVVKEIDRRLRSLGYTSVHMFVRWLRGGEDDTFWYTRPKCAVSLLVNTFPDSRIRTFMKTINRIAATASRRSRGAVLKVRLQDWDTGVRTSQNFWGVKQLSSSLSLLGKRASVSHFSCWTDGSSLAAARIPTVIFGPGSLRDAHTNREQVDVRDVKTAAMTIALSILSRRGNS